MIKVSNLNNFFDMQGLKVYNLEQILMKLLYHNYFLYFYTAFH